MKKISVRRNKDMFLMRQRKSMEQKIAGMMTLCCGVAEQTATSERSDTALL